MANSLQINNSNVFAGLGTATYVVPTGVATSLYTVQVKSTIPAQLGQSYDSSSLVGQSALQIQVKKNTVAQLTVGGSATNPTPTQQSIGGSVVLSLAAGDQLDVVFSSANAVDAVPNAVKSIINVFQGE